jgi:RNA polymerase sigma-54 factor
MINQHLAQKQRLKILPQQIQLLNFFQLNEMELSHRIEQELEENPILEKNDDEDFDSVDKFSKDQPQDYQDYDEFKYDDVPDYKMEYNNYLNTENIPERPVVQVNDFREDLKQQYRLNFTDDSELALADYIIDMLNDNGMLEQKTDDLAEDFSFKHGMWKEPDTIVAVIEKLKQLEPTGIAAADIRECLLMQLKKMNQKRPDVRVAIKILTDHYSQLKNCNTESICTALCIAEDEMKIVLELIGSLRMKPVAEMESMGGNRNIIPDYIITLEEDEIKVQLYKTKSHQLHINTEWKESVEAACKSKKDAEAHQYLKSKLNAAQWFISAVRQRETTMLTIMKTIVQLQHEYFREGDIKLLKPMILKNIADIVGVDISTVSRIASNKYAETHFGTILLKDLFTEGIVNSEGVVISNKVIQNAIEEVIQSEDKKNPLTDQQLVGVLLQKGFSVARRTVAKYRELLQIPVAQMRSVWA